MPDRTLPPTEALLLGAWLALEAAVVLLTALVALLLTVLSMAKKTAGARKPLIAPATSTPPAPPAQHPLALLAEGLQQLPHRELMTLAGTRRRLPKYQLAAMVAACS